MKGKQHLLWIAVMLLACFLAAPMALADAQSISGRVDQTDQGIVIVADDGDTYMVEGPDLSEWVGQTVQATGTVAEEDSGKVLTIINIEPVQE